MLTILFKRKMNEIIGLLHSLVQTANIEHVITPIVNHVSNLVLQNEAYESGEECAFSNQLVQNTENVASSITGLIKASNNLVTHSADQELINQMPKACDSLACAGEMLVSASQRLYAENFSLPARRHLIRSAKDVVETTLRVLLYADDVEVRKIIKSSDLVIRHLQSLTAVTKMDELVPRFKQFTEQVIDFTRHVERRHSDLIDKNQKEAILTCLQTLKRSIPMLSTALQTSVKYPNSVQARASRENAVGQILETVENLAMFIRSKQSAVSVTPQREKEGPGHFLTTVDLILDMLSPVRRQTALQADSTLDKHIGAVVRHCLAVIHFSGEMHRRQVTSLCQTVLQHRNELGELLKLIKSDGREELKPEFQDSADQLMQQLQRLEETVSLAVTHLVVEVFKEGTEPLERLARAFLTMPQLSADTLEAYKVNFLDHADAMCHVTYFLAAGCSDSNHVRELLTCVNQLERLDPEILPALYSCSGLSGFEPTTSEVSSNAVSSDPGIDVEHSVDPKTSGINGTAIASGHGRKAEHGTNCRSPGATQNMKLTKKEWSINVDLLISQIDNVIEPQTFMEISEAKIRDHIRRCRISSAMDLQELTTEVRAISGLCRRLAIVAKHVTDRKVIALERQACQRLLSLFKKNIQDFKSAANVLLSNHTHSAHHDNLQQRSDTLLAGLSRVMTSLSCDQDSLHDLLEETKDFEDFGNAAKLELNTNGKISGGKGISPPSSKHKPLVALSSQVSLHGLTLQGHAWNGKIDGVSRISTTNLAQGLDDSTILEPRHDGVCELVDKFISRATAGDRKSLEALKTSLLKWTNHCTECVKYILPLVENERRKVSLQDLSSDITRLIGDCIEGAEKLVACDTSALSEFYANASNFVKQISRILHEEDKLAGEWQVYSDKVIQSFQSKNKKLLAAQLTLLNKHTSSVLNIGNTSRSLCECVLDSRTSAHMVTLQSRCQYLERLTEKLHKSDTDGYSDAVDFELLSRDWAITIYVIVTHTERQCIYDVTKSGGLAQVSDRRDLIGLRQELSGYSQDTLRIKVLEEEILESLNDSSLKELTEELEKLLLQMEDQQALLSGVVPLNKQIEKVYAPYNLLLRKKAWCQKVDETLNALNKSTGDRMYITENANSKDMRTYVSQVKEMALAAIKPCYATDKRQEVMRFLKQLDEQTSQLEQTSATGSGRIRALCCRGKWALLCCLLELKIEEINTTNPVALKALKHLLQNPPSCHKTEDQNYLNLSNATSTVTSGTENLPQQISAKTPARERSPSRTGQDKGRPHSFVPETPQRTEIKEFAWRELKKGPSVLHRTPEAPKKPIVPSQSILKKTSPSEKNQIPAEFDQWSDDGNPIVTVARHIAQHVTSMEAYVKGQGQLQNLGEVILVSREVAVMSERLVKFCRILTDHSLDKKCAETLSQQTQRTPMLIAQLQILSTVGKESTGGITGDEQTSARMLAKTARNLLDAFTGMLNAAEAVCIKGLRTPAVEATDETATVVLATQWRKRVGQQRMRTNRGPRDEIGLRRVTQNDAAPALSQIMTV